MNLPTTSEKENFSMERDAFMRKTFFWLVGFITLSISAAVASNWWYGEKTLATIESAIILIMVVITVYAWKTRKIISASYFLITLSTLILFIAAISLGENDPGPLFGFVILPFLVGLLTIGKLDHLIISVTVFFTFLSLDTIGIINFPLVWETKFYPK